jgi:hypothetical protein
VLFALNHHTTDEKANLLIYFNLNESQQKIHLLFNIDEIGSLEKIIRKAILELVASLFISAEEWLIAIWNGVIKITDTDLHEKKCIAENLINVFELSIEEATRLLKRSGFTLALCTDILREGFNKSPEEIAALLRIADYSTEQIAKYLLLVIKPIETLKLLFKLDEPAESIGKALQEYAYYFEKNIHDSYKIADKQIGLFLKGLGKSNKEIVKILTASLNLNRKEIKEVLKSLHLPQSASDDMLKKVSALLDSVWEGIGI